MRRCVCVIESTLPVLILLLVSLSSVLCDVRDVQREIREAAQAAMDRVQKPVQPAGTDVILLNEANFDVITHGPTLLEFFAPWCGHCQHLAPTYERVATELKNDKIQVAKIDCTVSKELCNKFGIQGYPTIKYARTPSESEPLSLYEFNERDRSYDTILRYARTSWKHQTPGPFPEFIIQLLAVHAMRLIPIANTTIITYHANITEPTLVPIRRGLSSYETPSTFQSFVNHSMSSPLMLMLYIACLVCLMATCVYALCDCKLTDVDPHKQT